MQECDAQQKYFKKHFVAPYQNFYSVAVQYAFLNKSQYISREYESLSIGLGRQNIFHGEEIFSNFLCFCATLFFTNFPVFIKATVMPQHVPTSGEQHIFPFKVVPSIVI